MFEIIKLSTKATKPRNKILRFRKTEDNQNAQRDYAKGK